MEIKDLRCFLTVAKELNFNRAAEHLNMSQPPLTKINNQLEHKLGVKLFARTTRKVALTSAGLQLLQEAQSLIDQADTAARRIRHNIVNRKQHFVVGCTTLALFSFLPNLLTRFRKNYPEVKLDIQELSSKTIISKLVSAEIDVGFPLMPVSHNLLEVKSIWREQMKLAVPHFYPYTNQTVVPLNTFANEALIMHPRSEHPVMYEEIIRCCEQVGFKPLLKEVESGQSCIGLVTAGMGIHFVSSRIKCLILNDTTYIDTDPSPALEMVAVWRKEDKCEHLTLFRELILEE